MTRPLVPESGYGDAVAILVTLLGLPEADWDVERRRDGRWIFSEMVSGAAFCLDISAEWDHDERFAEGDDAQLWIYRNRPTDYARIAATIDACMALGDRPCRGGDCDEDAPCPRHRRRSRRAW